VLHTGLTPESAYSGKMGRVIAFALEAAGAPVVKGGAGPAVEAFRRLIEEKGGQIRTGADVDRITRARMAASRAWRLPRARTIACRFGARLGCAGADDGRLLRDADLPEDRRRRRPSATGGAISSCITRWTAPRLAGRGAGGCGADPPDRWDRQRVEIRERGGAGHAARNAHDLRGPAASAGPQPRAAGQGGALAADPRRATHHQGRCGGRDRDRRDWTEAAREAFADRIEGILRRAYRRVRPIKLARRAYSPADLDAMNVNLVGGDPYGGACSIDQFFLWRPFAQSRNGAMPVRGLRQIGASTHPGPGLGGGSGYLAAKALGA
jgi:phytoene dehydrogenase-like protein